MSRLLLVLLAALSGGCMTATIEQSRHTLTGVGDGDSIVVLALLPRVFPL